jgi:hypothetical protein
MTEKDSVSVLYVFENIETNVLLLITGMKGYYNTTHFLPSNVRDVLLDMVLLSPCFLSYDISVSVVWQKFGTTVF